MKRARQIGIKHTLVPPYHPASNRAAERSVRVVKEALVEQVLQGTGHMSLLGGPQLSSWLRGNCEPG